MADSLGMTISAIATYQEFVLLPPAEPRHTIPVGVVRPGEDPRREARRLISETFGVTVPSDAEVRVSADGTLARVILTSPTAPVSGVWLDIESLPYLMSEAWEPGAEALFTAGLEL